MVKRLYFLLPLSLLCISIVCMESNSQKNNNALVQVQAIDRKIISLEQWKINQSRVLQVLQAHQKNKSHTLLTIPTSSSLDKQESQQITHEDIQLFSDAVAQTKDTFHAFCVSLNENNKRKLISVAGKLGASRLSAQLLDVFLPREVVFKKIIPYFSAIINNFFERQVMQMYAHLHSHHIHYRINPIVNNKGEYVLAPDVFKSNKITWNGYERYCLAGKGIVVKAINPQNNRNYIFYKEIDRILRTIYLVREEGTLRLVPYNTKINKIVYDPTGKYFVTTSAEGEQVKMWCAQKGKLRAVLEGNEGCVTEVAFNHDGTLCVTGSNTQKNNLILHSVSDTSDCKKVNLEGHTGEISCAVFNNQGTHLVTSAKGRNCVILWNIYNIDNITVQVLIPFPFHISLLCFSPAGKRLITVNNCINSRQGRISLRDGLTGSCITRFTIGQVNAALFSPDSKYIIFADKDENNIKLCDGYTGAKIRVFNHPDTQCIGFIDNNHFFSRSDQYFKIWKLYEQEIESILSWIKNSLTMEQTYLLYSLINSSNRNLSQKKSQDTILDSFPTEPYNIQEFLKEYLFLRSSSFFTKKYT